MLTADDQNLSTMEKFCLELYAHLEKNLQECDAFRDSTLQWIECCFQVCELCCIKMQKHKSSLHFSSEDEEMRFLKVWQPRFTSLVEYYKFLYKAEIFAPQISRDAVEYWYHEFETATAFLQRHRSFHLDYKAGNTERDKEFFLVNKYGEHSSSLLLAKLIAKEKIAEYAIDKIRGIGVRSIV